MFTGEQLVQSCKDWGKARSISGLSQGSQRPLPLHSLTHLELSNGTPEKEEKQWMHGVCEMQAWISPS